VHRRGRPGGARDEAGLLLRQGEDRRVHGNRPITGAAPGDQRCRKGGTVSIPGVYGGLLDKLPFGAAFHKGLTLKMGQTHMMPLHGPLLDRVAKGEIDPSFVITHRVYLDDAPQAYRMFRDKRDDCVKVVMRP
jgi:threonine dehydrogenase-like Zn-dependent dehydrogenase